VEAVGKQSEALMAKNHIRPDQLMGSGVAIPGVFNREKGIVQATTSRLLANINLRERLEARLGTEVFIENDANMAALAQSISLHRRMTNLLFIYFSAGIGLGIIIDGRIYSGTSGFAGEIGHTRWLIASSGKDALSEDLKSLASMDSVLRQYDEGRHTDEEIKGNADRYIGEFLDACRKQDDRAIAILRKTGQIIGFVAAALADLFNPEMVILGGNIAPILDILLPVVREHARQASFTAQSEDLWIAGASDVESLILKGCGEVTFQEWLKNASILDSVEL
jgi:predicted NBD/HSP70 family sugar kinase